MRPAIVSTMVWLLLSLLGESPYAASLVVRGGDGTIIRDEGSVGGLCVATVQAAPGESLIAASVTAGHVSLSRVPETPGFTFWWPTDKESGPIHLVATWTTVRGKRGSATKLVRVRQVLLKIRVEIPQDTPEDRTVYVAGSLFGLGMTPDGRWRPRVFPLTHLGHGHWFGKLLVGPGDRAAMEFTLGGWGTKGRDKNGEKIHLVRRIGNHVEIAARVHNWGLRRGTPGDRSPYLSVGDPSGASVVMAFRNAEQEKSVWIGKSPGKLSSKRLKHDAGGSFYTISSLQPGERHYYRVAQNGPTYSFVMPEADELRFCVIGDTKGQSDVLAAMAAHESPQLILDTGDFMDSGWDENQWNRSLASSHPLAATTPYMMAPGNHEEESPIFGEVFHFPGREYYYAFSFGPARFLVLDSELPYEKGSPQRAFAESVLTSWRISPDIPSFAVLHAPPYSSRKHGSDLSVRTELCPLFEWAGISIVFSGHDHGYEVTWPLKAGRRDLSGTVYLVTAGGGAPLYDTRGPKRSWSRLCKKRAHWISVHVSGTNITVEAIARDGEVFDRFSRPSGSFISGSLAH